MFIMFPLENLIMGDTQEWDQQRPAYSGTVIPPSTSSVDTSTVETPPYRVHVSILRYSDIEYFGS